MNESSHREVRASDADRDRVASALRAHCVEGRLSMTELSERLSATYAARTLGQLADITADLPELDEHPLPVPARRGSPSAVLPSQRSTARADRQGASVAAEATCWVGVSALCVLIWALIWALSGLGSYFWPAWVIGPWGVTIMWRAVSRRFGQDRPHNVD